MEQPNSSSPGKRSPFDDTGLLLPKRQRVRRRKACERCHKKKVKCDFKIPCSTCVAAGLKDKCEYLKVEKPVYINVRKDYIEDIVHETELLKKQLSIVTAQLLKQPGLPERKNVSSGSNRTNYNPMSLSSILENGLKTDPDDNPLVADQNIPQTKTYFNYMGDSACSKFNTKLQQYVLLHLDEVKPRSDLIGDLHSVKYEDDELHWNNANLFEGYTLPDKSEAHSLIGIAFKYVGVEYYLVMIDSFGKLVDKIYEKYKPGKKISLVPNKDVTRSQMAQFFAMCALGSLYSGSIGDAKYKVPGTHYFKIAVALLEDNFEEPNIDYIEALSQIGYYSYTLNRMRSAFAYTGLALRTALSLGLHRRASFWNNTKLDLRQRERGRRLFYTLFIFDRLICAKLGYPVSIDEEDIDTELPSEIYFTEQEYREFPDSKYILAQIQIASISTLIVKNIYGISQLQNKDKKKNFVLNVHGVLSRLKDCYENLDPTLKLQHFNNQSLNNVLRNIFSFHMHYNQLVILATRPLLLYIFTRSLVDATFVPSQVTSAIGEACIQSAYAINSVIGTLYRIGKISSFGFFDAHYCFSSTIILIISRTLTKFDAQTGLEIDRRINDATNILQNLARLGSIPLENFSIELDNLQKTLSNLDVNKITKVFTRSELKDDNSNFNKLQSEKNTHSIAYTSATSKTSDVLQILGGSSLDDEILSQFLNSNFEKAVDRSLTGELEDLFKIDNFDQMSNILQDFQYGSV